MFFFRRPPPIVVVPFIALVIVAVAFDLGAVLTFLSIGALILYVLAILLGEVFS